MQQSPEYSTPTNTLSERASISSTQYLNFLSLDVGKRLDIARSRVTKETQFLRERILGSAEIEIIGSYQHENVSIPSRVLVAGVRLAHLASCLHTRCVSLTLDMIFPKSDYKTEGGGHFIDFGFTRLQALRADLKYSGQALRIPVNARDEIYLAARNHLDEQPSRRIAEYVCHILTQMGSPYGALRGITEWLGLQSPPMEKYSNFTRRIGENLYLLFDNGAWPKDLPFARAIRLNGTLEKVYIDTYPREWFKRCFMSGWAIPSNELLAFVVQQLQVIHFGNIYDYASSFSESGHLFLPDWTDGGPVSSVRLTKRRALSLVTRDLTLWSPERYAQMIEAAALAASPPFEVKNYIQELQRKWR